MAHTQNANPLSGSFRRPKSFVKLLGSDIGVYKDGFIVCDNDNDEVGVKSMTGQDEMTLNNPDGLLNGESIITVIKSCCPSITDPTKLLHADVKLLMAHIRRNSFGVDLDYDLECPKCSQKYQTKLNLDALLSKVTRFETESDQVKLDDDLIVYTAPYNFEQYKKILAIGFKEQQSITALQSKEISEEERVKRFSKIFKSMSDLNYDLTVESIYKITYQDNVVTERQYIKEFVDELDRDSAQKVKDHTDLLAKIGVNNEVEVTCTGCGHVHKESVNFDQMGFFTQSSTQETQP